MLASRSRTERLKVLVLGETEAKVSLGLVTWGLVDA